MSLFDSPLFYEDQSTHGLWREGFGELSNEEFDDEERDYFVVRSKANAKARNSPTNRGQIVIKIQLEIGMGKCRAVHPPNAAVVIKTNKLPRSVAFFEIVTSENIYSFGAVDDVQRIEWIYAINEAINGKRRSLRFTHSSSSSNTQTQNTEMDNELDDKDTTDKHHHRMHKQNTYVPTHLLKQHSATGTNQSLADQCSSCNINITRDTKIFGLIKIDAFISFVQLCLGYPFVIISAAISTSSGSLAFLKSVHIIWLLNVLIYVSPIVLVKIVLSEYLSYFSQRITIGIYLLFYLLPVAYVSFVKILMSSSSTVVDDGTFNFKPASSVKLTADNVSSIIGILFEWIQHVLYVLPTGIITGDQVTKLSDYPPYLPFEVYFWICVASTFLCGFILILNSLLRGKILYQFRESKGIWIFLYNVGSPMFMTVVTILFMSLDCDLTVDPPVLMQDETLVCYSPRHTTIASVGLVTLAVYIVHNTLLPSGTYKESMGGNSLDIMFVPAYLQAHFLFKAIFAGVYVFYYSDDMTRAITLTAINVMLLCLNAYMKPCSVESINVLRNTIFVHSTFSGIQSLNYLVWPISSATKDLVVSSLITNCVFTTIIMYLFYFVNRKSTEYTIATTFLDLEWQVNNGGAVNSRALEPLISLTLSQNKADTEIAKKYISQLVWLVSYPNVRVQFQSAWGLANISLIDDEARVNIYREGGFRTLYEWYCDMDNIGQLEALATMANLTLSDEVAAEMVKIYKCIPFFINIISSSKLKHSQFATIALGNLARKESFREIIYRHGGMAVLVGCVLSHNIEKRRYGCLASANMALSSREEFVEIFESQAILDRIIHLARKIDIGTQREITALIRHLSCHSHLCAMLATNKDINSLLRNNKYSVYEDVRTWSDEVLVRIVDQQISTGRASLSDALALRKIAPLSGQVEWSTWGSKLEGIFAPLFARVPKMDENLYVVVNCDQTVKINLSVGVPRNTVKNYRDNLSFSILERPLHGKLPDYVPPSHEITYTPNDGFIGMDSFTFKMNISDYSSLPATAHITVLGPDGEANETDGIVLSPSVGASPRTSARSAADGNARQSTQRKLKPDMEFDDIYPRSFNDRIRSQKQQPGNQLNRMV